MPDPLDVLLGGDAPADPDPRFATELRSRLREALTARPPLTRGGTVTTTADRSLQAAPRRRAPAALTPYLAVSGARRAIDWYAEVLGARVVDGPIVMPDGRVGHAELELGPDAGSARLMLSEEHPEIAVVAPDPGGGAAVTLHLAVGGVDALVARAQQAGALIERPPVDQPYGRVAVLRDPFGHRWMLNGTRADLRRRHGDVGYASFNVPDAERAAGFFAAVLGWEYAPARDGRARQVVGQSLHHGIWAQPGDPTLFLCFAVSDLDAALAAVAAAGGTAGEAGDQPHGRVADCHDDQGTAFALYQPPGGVDPGAPRPETRPGDIAYLTMRVASSARARAFYGAVLAWEFSPGRVRDGWDVADPHPRLGLSGGHHRPSVVPVYAVAAVDDAAAAVGAAGGTSGRVEEAPYGRIVECTDDQGTQFALLELAG